MKESILNELQRLTIAVATGCAGGFYFNAPWIGAGLGLAFYTGWMLLELKKLLAWLNTGLEQSPPDSTGIWSVIFTRLYKFQRMHLNTQRRMSTALERTFQSTAVLRDGVVLLDKNSRITWWNAAAERFLGLKKGLDVGQILTHLLRDPIFIDYFQHRNFDEPLEILSPRYENLRLQLTVTLFGDAEYLIFVRDITRLHELERMRQDFIANVSHELRTPLTVIVGYLETLLEQPSITPQQNHQALSGMQKQADRMNALVQDLLLLSGLSTTPPAFSEQPIDICSMLESIHRDAQQLMPDKKLSITLVMESHTRLRGNEQELHSAFANLVFNAVKYTPTHGKIELRWFKNEKGAHFAVTDNGIGIEAKHIPRLTERFYRVDKSRSVATGGTGLGLSITKHVLLRHDAQLEIQSVVGKGSCFTCHFPSDIIVAA